MIDRFAQHYKNLFFLAIRQENYKEILELVGFATINELLENHENEDSLSDRQRKPSLKLLSPSDTRWLIIADCLERILMQVNPNSLFLLDISH